MRKASVTPSEQTNCLNEHFTQKNGIFGACQEAPICRPDTECRNDHRSEVKGGEKIECQ
jgi:hypothetical protein